MRRIPLTPKATASGATPAPYLEGVLMFKGQQVPGPMFMVDTGADLTLIGMGPEQLYSPIYQQGSKSLRDGSPCCANGVGGSWPARMFSTDWTLAVLVEDTETKHMESLTLTLPTVFIMAPLATNRGERLAGPLTPLKFTEADRVPIQLPGSRPADFEKRLAPYFRTPVAPNLLGRDVLQHNGLRIDWGPGQQSWLTVNPHSDDLPS